MDLKKHRKAKGYSIPAFSELSGIPIRTVEDIERRKDCRVSTAIKLADALGMTLDELCREEAED